jgi:hypothetical protein
MRLSSLETTHHLSKPPDEKPNAYFHWQQEPGYIPQGKTDSECYPFTVGSVADLTL